MGGRGSQNSIMDIPYMGPGTKEGEGPCGHEERDLQMGHLAGGRGEWAKNVNQDGLETTRLYLRRIGVRL